MYLHSEDPSSDLIKIRNLGKDGQKEVIDKIHSLGLKFADE